MSLKIGGAAPAPISLKIGGPKVVSIPVVKAPTPGSSKAPTPINSKPGTPAPGDKKVAPAAAGAVKETKAAIAAKSDAVKTTDGDTLKKEVEAAADEETLKDLYGGDEDCAFNFWSV